MSGTELPPGRHGARGALSADVLVHRDGFTLQVALEIPAGGRLAVLGPNGSGKSTLLAALAGLVRLDGGHTTVDSVVSENAGHVRLRAEQRHIALLNQKPRLFPHLTVAQNIAFAPRARGVGRAASLRIAMDWLERLGMPEHAKKRPEALSGGQQQRVALARALASEPALVLLDEPFAAVDAENAPLLRMLLAEELTARGISSILVTHDLADAWQLADMCLVLADGRVVETGPPGRLAASPHDPFTARLAGFSVVEGRWTGGGLRIGDGIELPGLAHDVQVGDEGFAVLDPRHVGLRFGAHPMPGELSVRIDAVTIRAGILQVSHRSGLAAEHPSAGMASELTADGDFACFRVPPVTVRRRTPTAT